MRAAEHDPGHSAPNAPFASARLVLAPCNDADGAVLEAIAAEPRVAHQLWVGLPGRLRAELARPGQVPGALRLCARAADGAVIGFVQCVGGQLSYFIRPDAWGQGLGSEMVEAVCALPAMRQAVIRAEVMRENLASRRILERAGFRYVSMFLRPWTGRPGRATMLAYVLPAQSRVLS
jgi:RimJ/RimL family protein N-acetyltransferase